MGVARLFEPLRRCIALPGDTDVQRLRKLIYPSMLVVSWCVTTFTAAQRLSNEDLDLVFFAAAALSAWDVCFLASVLCQKRVSDRNMFSWIVGSVLCLFVADLDHAAAMMARSWPVLVLYTDAALVCKLPSRSSLCLVAMGVGWLVVTQVEAVYRYGLYDVSLTSSYSERRANCSCARPPCKIPPTEGLHALVIALVVFSVDFFITRSFAWGLTAEKEKMQTSIEAARDVSELLVRFQLAEAETLLRRCSSGDQSEIPGEFVAVLSGLLANLKRYEPFLPQSCFLYAGDGGSTAGPDSAASDDGRGSLTQSLPAWTAKLSLRHSIDEYVRRTVSIAALNVRGLHELLEPRATHRDAESKRVADNDAKNDIASLQKVFLSLIVIAASKTKGIVDFFMGDHVACSWNASRPCVSHRSMAVSAAYEVGIGSLKASIVTHGGVSSGEALCGNMGTETLRRYNIVGRVYSLAHTIVSVARDWGIRLLIDTTMAKDVMTAYEVVAVPEMLTYCKGTTSLPLILWRVERANHGEVGAEWMYTVQSPGMMQVSFVNTLTVAYLKGQREETANILAERTVPQAARRLVEWLRNPPGDAAPTQLPLVTPRLFTETT
ncbi:hypothetical protein DIPPA_21054 [Diplonema papillatum]|nr:hypothetical protein DIPPA_21054 [Diplonema papillatum]|eukprot:gene23461-biopygen21064